MFHFSDECSGIIVNLGISGHHSQGTGVEGRNPEGKKVSLAGLRLVIPIAPRSIPLAGTLCVGKSVISATTLSGASMFQP